VIDYGNDEKHDVCIGIDLKARIQNIDQSIAVVTIIHGDGNEVQEDACDKLRLRIIRESDRTLAAMLNKKGTRWVVNWYERYECYVHDTIVLWIGGRRLQFIYGRAPMPAAYFYDQRKLENNHEQDVFETNEQRKKTENPSAINLLECVAEMISTLF
jgi:hypothetical protein